ncbi:unnamed protein product [Prunus brigantina]
MILDVTRDRITRHDEPIPTCLWYALITTNLKIDAAWHSSSHRDGAGIIIRNAHGMFVGTKVIIFSIESSMELVRLLRFVSLQWSWFLLVFISNQTQRNSWTASMTISK